MYDFQVVRLSDGVKEWLHARPKSGDQIMNSYQKVPLYSKSVNSATKISAIDSSAYLSRYCCYEADVVCFAFYLRAKVGIGNTRQREQEVPFALKALIIFRSVST